MIFFMIDLDINSRKIYGNAYSTLFWLIDNVLISNSKLETFHFTLKNFKIFDLFYNFFLTASNSIKNKGKSETIYISSFYNL